MLVAVRVQIKLVVWAARESDHSNLYISWPYVKGLGETGDKVQLFLEVGWAYWARGVQQKYNICWVRTASCKKRNNIEKDDIDVSTMQAKM